MQLPSTRQSRHVGRWQRSLPGDTGRVMRGSDHHVNCEINCIGLDPGLPPLRLRPQSTVVWAMSSRIMISNKSSRHSLRDPATGNRHVRTFTLRQGQAVWRNAGGMGPDPVPAEQADMPGMTNRSLRGNCPGAGRLLAYMFRLTGFRGDPESRLQAGTLRQLAKQLAIQSACRTRAVANYDAGVIHPAPIISGWQGGQRPDVRDRLCDGGIASRWLRL